MDLKLGGFGLSKAKPTFEHLSKSMDLGYIFILLFLFLIY